MIPRWIARSLAFMTGRFWISCPLCGNEFGGQEWKTDSEHYSDIPGPEFQVTSVTTYHRNHIDITQITGATAICPECTDSHRGCEIWALNPDAPWTVHPCVFNGTATIIRDLHQSKKGETE